MVVTTLGYLFDEGKVLLLHRIKKKNDINQDKWIGIGGKLEEGESVLACMQRECREETGLVWKDPQLKGIITFNFRQEESDPLFSELMFLYCGSDFTGRLKECDEGELVWMDWDEMFKLNLWKGDRIFLQIMRESNDLFYMVLDYLGDELVFAALNEKPVDLDDPRWN